MSKQALLIVDMQQGLFSANLHDADGLVRRIESLADRLRREHVPIIFIQHCGGEGHQLHPAEAGHAIHEGLSVNRGDLLIRKLFCDAFLVTALAGTLSELDVGEVIVTGCATEFCVDTTIRSALGRGFRTIVPDDGHTTFDRPNLPAKTVIEHHNALWANFLSPAGGASMTRCQDIT